MSATLLQATNILHIKDQRDFQTKYVHKIYSGNVNENITFHTFNLTLISR